MDSTINSPKERKRRKVQENQVEGRVSGRTGSPRFTEIRGVSLRVFLD